MMLDRYIRIKELAVMLGGYYGPSLPVKMVYRDRRLWFIVTS